MKKKAAIFGYKGFDKDLKCRDFQYEVGKEYSHEGTITICDSGFHFCELPMDVLSYYPLLNENQYAIVEARGTVKNNGDKSVTDKIFLHSKIDIAGIVKASVELIWERAKKGGILKKNSATSGERANSATSGYGAHSATSGNYAHSATSGERANSATSGNDAHSATSGYGAHSATSGNYAHSATSGNYAHSATSGERANSATSGYGAHSATSGIDNIACAVGRQASAKASLGCWIVVAEWQEGKEYTDAKPVCVLSAKVDGKKIKADTFYKVEGGKFIEVTE